MVVSYNNTRYGLEGNETMMTVVDEIFRNSSKGGVEEVVLAMPHRGRLNLLTGLLRYFSVEKDVEKRRH